MSCASGGDEDDRNNRKDEATDEVPKKDVSPQASDNPPRGPSDSEIQHDWHGQQF
jgi:hypothetical protein